MNTAPHLVYRLLDQLEAAKFHYRLLRVREDTIMVFVRVPGRRYEIEIFADGSVEVEVFKGDGQIGGQELIDELLANYSD
jgi:hypothetical protein